MDNDEQMMFMAAMMLAHHYCLTVDCAYCPHPDHGGDQDALLAQFISHPPVVPVVCSGVQTDSGTKMGIGELMISVMGGASLNMDEVVATIPGVIRIMEVDSPMPEELEVKFSDT